MRCEHSRSANKVAQFFSKLATLFDARSQQAHGSVFLVQKRLSHDPSAHSSSAPPKPTANPTPDTLADLQPTPQLPVLVRATTGQGKTARAEKVKLSTVVQPGDLEVFYARYAEVCKAGMAGLKKRDRKARRKDRAKKKKGAAGGGGGEKG